ncbi:Osmotically-inducible lipoprotein E precursor [compost metagenome]
MHKQTLAVLCLFTLLAGCSSKPQNPVDFVTFHDEPLVKQVEDGMTMQRVIAIGGTPSAMIDMQRGGTCNNYILNRDGHQQAYYVFFNESGLVASKGFMTCEQYQNNKNS